MSIGIITKENIKKMQTALQLSGHYTGIIDGIAGDGTVKAVKAAADASVVTTEPIEIPVGSTVVVTPPEVTEPLPEMAQFFLSETSLQRMNGIKTKLRDVVKRAIQISEVDFMVVEGLRTKAKQAEYVKKGASQTMNSKHLTGDAVDIVPYVKGKADWDNWDNIFKMTVAMQKAAQELGIPIKWGGAWVVLNSQSDTPYQLVEQYKARQRYAGKKAFMDGVHFELA